METCYTCGRPLVQRTNKTTKEKFMGCSGFPKCRGPVYKKKIRGAYIPHSFSDYSDDDFDTWQDYGMSFDDIF